ncbi:Gfo/Idh/MocA family oxidoreductase [Candidatus Aerophobetes bacterium]|nr:Gfo/Idh/MocA family oxidoreductase [Candidatus Aerophobetes bacterium]
MINIAVAGVGAWGKNVVRNFYEIKEVNLTFCYDFNPASLKWVKENFPDVNTTDDFNQVLTNKKIDAVIIATPAPTHFEFAKQALCAGKHVLVEKPLTLSSSDAARLVDLSKENNRKLMVGHLLKYHPAVLEMRRIVKAGELGKIWYIHSQRLGLGRVREVENAMWCLATHDIYTAIYLMGKYPYKVSATGESFLQKEKGIEDVVFLNLFFGEETFAHIHVSWIDPEKIRKTTVVGDNKMMVFDEIKPPPKLKIYDSGITVEQSGDKINFKIRKKNELALPIANKQPLKEECLHFIKCIREDKTPFTDGEEGLRIVKVLEAAQRSLKQNCSIEVRV